MSVSERVLYDYSSRFALLVATIFCTATVLNVCKAPWSLHGLKRHSISSADMIMVTYWGTARLMPEGDYAGPSHSAKRQT